MINYLTINEVCQLYKTTPRTLRYYESEGLITSTRKTESSARVYSPLELEKIKQVLLLRSIHLSINDIKDLMAGKNTLNHSIGKKLKSLYLKREDLLKQIITLEKASNLLLDNKYIDSVTLEDSLQNKVEAKLKSFISNITRKLINQEFNVFFESIDNSFFEIVQFEFLQHICHHIIRELGIDIIIENINIINKYEVHVTITGSLRSYLITYGVTSGPKFRIDGLLFTEL